MSAREIIARALCLDPDECVFGSGWTGGNGGGFECSMRAWEQKLPAAHAAITALTAGGYRILAPGELALGVGWKFPIGERVTKIKGSSWTGRVVGFYSTSLTPIGYNVESESETGSVQLYPEAAIRSLPVENGGGG